MITTSFVPPPLSCKPIETRDSEEDAVLLAQLQRVSWSDLTVNDARERIQQVLSSLHVSDNDVEGRRKKKSWDTGKDKDHHQHSEPSEDNDNDKTKSDRPGTGAGNRAHIITGWAAVMKQGLGGMPLISLSKHAIK